jgi:predicted ATPase
VRIAFSGTHRTGKTTLVAAIAELLPTYRVIDEPYRLLEESGHDFADPPSVEDFEQQLRTSIELLATAPADALLDRCPLDFIAYLQAIDDDVDVDDWLDDIRDAMARVDLVILVPIETPERIAVPDHEDRRLRRRVDERLQRLVLDDPFGFELATLEVSGSLAERVGQVMRATRAAG